MTTPVAPPPLVVSELGDPAAPAVVLVHGIGVSERYFRPLSGELARDRWVLVPDLPGFGRSPRPRRAPTVEQMADAVLAVLAARRTGPAVLVGHSMGAQVVLAMAARAPDQARAVVLIGPVVDPAAPSAVGQGIRLARDTLHEPLPVNAVIVADYLRAGPRWYLAVLRHMLTFDTTAAVARVACPVLVVRGEQDAVCSRAWAQRLAASAAHGEVREVPRAAHVAMATHPAVVAGWVEALGAVAASGEAV